MMMMMAALFFTVLLVGITDLPTLVDGFSIVIPHHHRNWKLQSKASSSSSSLFGVQREASHFQQQKDDGTKIYHVADGEPDEVMEEYLEKAKLEMDEAVRTSYHKGGSQSKAVTEPTALNIENVDGEECDEIFTDLATGDELCWNESKFSSPPTSLFGDGPRRQKVTDTSRFETEMEGPTAKSLHKGGSQNAPMTTPTKLGEDEIEDCDEPYIDFATGDELCWTD